MLMGVAAMAVTAAALAQLCGATENAVNASLANVLGLVLAVFLKAGLYCWIRFCLCSGLVEDSPAVAAVQQDHFNDVLSNGVAVVAARAGELENCHGSLGKLQSWKARTVTVVLEDDCQSGGKMCSGREMP